MDTTLTTARRPFDLTSSPWLQTPSRDELIRVLRMHGVPIEEFGTEGWRTFDDLLRYFTDDQFWFPEKNRRPLTYEVNAIIVNVYHGDEELYEECQINLRTGKKIERDFWGVGETMKKCEREKNGRLDDVARRALGEELRWFNPALYRLSGLVVKQTCPPVVSEKWPGGEKGLFAIYHRHVVECVPSEDLYDSKGYIHTDGDWQVRFVWRPRRNKAVGADT